MAQQKWTPEEDAVVVENYANGWRAVREILPHRSKKAIFNRASDLDASQSYGDEPAVVVPGMTLIERIDCQRLRKWGGPVDRSRPLIGRLSA